MDSLYSFFTAFAAAFGGLLFGYEIGIVSTVLAMRSFNSFFGIRLKDEKGIVVVEGTPRGGFEGDIVLWFILGCMLGTVVVGILADKLGRKKSILIGLFVFTLGSFVQCFSGSRPLLHSGRFVGGCGVGILSNVVPLYISETAPTRVRGAAVAVLQLMITIGILIANLVNMTLYYTMDPWSDMMWRLALGVQAVPGIILFCCMFMLPYSPRWLANKGRNEDALVTLARLRRQECASAVVQDEFHAIMSSIWLERQTGSASFKELVAPGIRNRVAICVILQSFQQFSGINAIMYFAATLFLNMGFPSATAATIPGTISALVNVLATIPGVYLVDRIGRRKLLISGGLVMGASMTLVTVFAKLSDINKGEIAYSYLGALFIYASVASFAYSWGPVVWIYQSEIFPLRMRGKGTAIATFSNWACNGVVAKVAPLLMEKEYLGNLTYLIFSTLALAMAAFVYFRVPETKGYSLEEMDEIFDPKFASPSSVKPPPT